MIFAYSWFPRVWVSRNDHFQDMYYGKGIDELQNRKNKYPIYIMRLFDRSDYVSPKTYIQRLRKLNKSTFLNHRFLLLESFGSLFQTLYNYFSFDYLYLFFMV